MSELILASASPRRAQLLGQLGIAFRVLPSDIDESRRAGETPVAYVQRMAAGKARAAQALAGVAADAFVLGADTSVIVDDDVLGKPADARECAAMLRRLSAREHEVLSGIALARGAALAQRLSRTRVRFRALADAEIEAYWRTGEPRDKAGGYAIQGLAAAFVERIEGSYSGVMGLPLYDTAALLGDAGLFRLGAAP